MLNALVAEDEMLVREVIIEELADAGFLVTAVGTADAALTHIEDGAAIDLLFTDIRMPGTIDGWELGRRALALRPDLKIVYATGYSDSDAALSANERRMAKPYRLEDILATLKCLQLI